MSNLFEDITKEIIGAIVLLFTGFIFIIVLVSIGEATGQNEIAKQAIQAILIAIGGIGIPVGIIAIIKWLGGFSNERFY
jgi:uncharacterized membrane protein